MPLDSTTKAKIDDVVNYHKPTELDLAKIGLLREATGDLIKVIVENCPPSPDRSAAIRKARETLMTANASIVAPQVTF